MNDYTTRPFIVLILAIGLTMALDSAAFVPSGPTTAQDEHHAPRVGQTSDETYPQAVDKSPLPPKKVRKMAQIVVENWFDHQQFICYDNIIMAESRYNLEADNKHSTAWGIGQILNSQDNVGTDPYQQIITALNYMIHKYHTPCQAWTFHKKHRWY